MADKRQPSRRSSSSGKTSGKQAASQKQAAPRQASSGKPPVSQRQTPIRRPDMIRCENCGEDYSSTYKRCPFCDERPGRTGIGGRRVAGGGNGQVHPVQLVGLVISLVLIIAALFIVFTRIAPLFTKDSGGAGSSVSTSQSGSPGSDASGSGSSTGSSSTDTSLPSGSSSSGEGSGSTSQGTPVTPGTTVTSITLNKTDMTLQPNETTQLTATLSPTGATGTVTWSSSDTSLATVDEYGNVKNVNQGTEKKKAVITATCGEITATCDVHCRPVNESSDSGDSSSGESGGSSTGGNTSGPVAANTPGTIVNAGNGLNVRSGPGSSYDKIASIKNGNKVTILEDTGSGWYKVDIGGGVTGYVSSDYVSVN